jgi:arsenate reductase
MCHETPVSPRPPAEDKRLTEPHPPFEVLFLCNSNCGRSLFAEAILNREGEGRFRAHSGGAHPAAEANPIALDILEKLGHDTSSLAPKSWDIFREPGAPQFDFVFTVCDEAAGEPCPAWPGDPMHAHWGVPDPTKFVGSEAETYAVYEEAYRMLLQRVRLFTSLPIRELDRMSLHGHVSGIGG